MLVVIALGGNALAAPGQTDVSNDRVMAAAQAVGDIAAEGHSVVVTHGNGPQIGLLALESDASGASPGYPLDVLGAQTEGMIGYLLERELRNLLKGHEIASLLTQVVVSPTDPAFGHPVKPIGPVYNAAQAKELTAARGWTLGPDHGGWRRLVPSPLPRSIVELHTIELLVRAGVVVICAGGGGVPVVVDREQMSHGVEAVVDKDRAAALLARQLGADLLLLLTDVDAVYREWGTPEACPIATLAPEDVEAQTLAPGTMGPKVEAAAWFAATSPGRAAIGSLAQARSVLDGTAGTSIARVPHHTPA